MRNQGVKDAIDAIDVSAGGRRDDDALDESEEPPPPPRLSPVTSRGRRKQERANKSRPNEMTEEEMIDLALRLSEQEASIVAIRRQKEEEEAMMKAIQESMTQPNQPRPPSQSQSLLEDTDVPSLVCTRRNLSCSNGKTTPAVSQGPAEGGGGGGQKRGTKRSAEINQTGRKRRRKAGSPLLEILDSSQTQNVDPQTPPSSCVVLDLDSQSSDSTQIEDCPLRRSPVFPSSYCKAEVHVPRLDRDLVRSCVSSGFVWCSQDSSPLKSLPPQSASPTFPKTPERSSPVLSDLEDGGESAPEDRTSPSPSRPRVQNCNPEFIFSSQDSLTSEVRSASCRRQSPVFPKSPAEPAADRGSPGSSWGRGSPGSSGGQGSPVFDRMERVLLETQKRSIKQDVGAVLVPPVGTSLDPRPRGQSPRPCGETSEDQSGLAEQPLSSNMTLLWSDEDEDAAVGSPSPVFPEEGPFHGADDPGSPSRRRLSSSTEDGRIRSGESVDRRQTAGEAPTVHYYWGVPFCPRGLDPDHYTQVILAQMDVYEKSLKTAQRGLPRKAEWGDAIVPQPQSTHQTSADSPQDEFSRRRVLRLRGQKSCDAGETPAPAEEEGDEDEQTEERHEDDGGQMDADDGHICPETQLSHVDEDRTRDVIVVADSVPPQCPSKSPELLDVDTLLRDDSPAVDEQLEEDDIDALLDSNSDGGVSDRGRKEDEVEGTGDGGQPRTASPDLDPPVTSRDGGTSVDCPICQRSFPMAEIEVHAAYCDGDGDAADRTKTKADAHQGERTRVLGDVLSSPVSPRPRRKRKKAEPGEEEEDEVAESCSAAREKCYVCQATVPLRDYGRHTELCIRRRRHQQPGRSGPGDPVPGFLSLQKENLLSALDKTEAGGDARPGGSRLQPGYVIDLLNDDEEAEGEEGGGARISDSPIRSFTSISDAADCLIDFRKQQHPRKLSRRRR